MQSNHLWIPRTANFEGIRYIAPCSLKENFGFVMRESSGCIQAIRGRKKKFAGKEITQFFAETTFEGIATALVPFCLLLCKHFSWTAANAQIYYKLVLILSNDNCTE